MNYSFSADVAVEYGVNEAIIIANFRFWILKNKACDDNFFDGRTWTYNTVKALHIIFPFFTEKQIRGVLDSLVKKEVLLVGNYNKSAYDRTKWYAFKDEKRWVSSICPDGQMEVTERANRFAEKGEPIPDNKPDNKPDSKEKEKKEALSVPEFINQKSWNEFEQHRKEIKKPLTDLARKKAFNQLKALSVDQQQEVIDYSITGRYTGLFTDRVTKTQGGAHAAFNGNGQHETNAQRNARVSAETSQQFAETVAAGVAAGVV